MNSHKNLLLIETGYLPFLEEHITSEMKLEDIVSYEIELEGETSLVSVFPAIEDSSAFWKKINGKGIENVVCFSKAVSINPELRAGELVVPEDHMNFMARNPLIDYFKEEKIDFFDIKSVYVDLEKKYGLLKGNLSVSKGVLLAMEGPSVMTEAEETHFKQTGGDFMDHNLLPSVFMSFALKMKALYFALIINQVGSNVFVNETELKKSVIEFLQGIHYLYREVIK